MVIQSYEMNRGREAMVSRDKEEGKREEATWRLFVLEKRAEFEKKTPVEPLTWVR